MANPDHAFQLEILSQQWIKPDDGRHDPCSHGTIRAVIGGAVVTSTDGDYGISQSALLLLRTVEADFSTSAETPFVHYLLCHGCGHPFGFGCTNFGTSWDVTHKGDQVVLSSPVLHAPELPGHQTSFNVSARLSLADYRRQVIDFAEAAHRFYFDGPPKEVPEPDRRFHDAFWAEFEDRLQRARAADA